MRRPAACACAFALLLAACSSVAPQCEPSDLAPLQAALALSVSPNADDAEIMAMVEPLMRRGAQDADVRAMASFLHAISSDRRRLREAAAAAANRAREDRRALDAQRLRAEALQERAAQLQQKLDALTTLEKSIAERERQGK